MPKVAKSSTGARSTVAALAVRNVLDSKRLFYFYHVARLGSFSTAETVLDVAQSAISRQIQHLEAELGVQLLERTGHGVSLTEFGGILYQQAEGILQNMATTVELLNNARRHPAGQLSIASPTIFSSLYMPEVIRRFIDLFPQVSLTAYEATTGQVYDYLASGQVDLAIVLHSATSQKLNLQKLLVEPLVVIASASHPIAKRESIQRADLEHLEMVLPGGVHGSRALIETYCQQGGIQLHPHVRLDGMSIIKEVVRQGRFCTIWPRSACSAELASGEFVARPLVPVLKRTLYLASLRDREQTPYMKAMAREISSVVRAILRTEDESDK